MDVLEVYHRQLATENISLCKKSQFFKMPSLEPFSIDGSRSLLLSFSFYFKIFRKRTPPFEESIEKQFKPFVLVIIIMQGSEMQLMFLLKSSWDQIKEHGSTGYSSIANAYIEKHVVLRSQISRPLLLLGYNQNFQIFL